MEVRSSWWTFAGIMVIVGGFLNLFDGLVPPSRRRVNIQRRIGGELPITNDVKTWGWVALIVGVIMLLAGFGILSGANWAPGRRHPGRGQANLLIQLRVPRPQPVLGVHDDRHRHPGHLRPRRTPRRRRTRTRLNTGWGCSLGCIPNRSHRTRGTVWRSVAATARPDHSAVGRDRTAPGVAPSARRTTSARPSTGRPEPGSRTPTAPAAVARSMSSTPVGTRSRARPRRLCRSSAVPTRRSRRAGQNGLVVLVGHRTTHGAGTSVR